MTETEPPEPQVNLTWDVVWASICCGASMMLLFYIACTGELPRLN